MSSSNITRRGFLGRSTASSFAFALGCSVAYGQNDNTETKGAQLITPKTQKAIDRSLEHLANQLQTSGAFSSSGPAANPAITSLAGMAFMSSGSTPNRGPYGKQVSRCLDYLLSRAQDSGYITTPGSQQPHGPMYGHGFATLFLAEAFGMASHLDIREKLNRAVQLIVSSQNKYDAWRYVPNSNQEDLSITVCQIMALRAARNAGIYVPHDTIERCIRYVKKCQNSDGGFVYQLEHGGGSAFPRSAAGVVALYSAGIYDGPEITKGLKYLMRFLPSRDSSTVESHYYYGHYYAVQAMWSAGGQYWSRWYPAIRDELLRRQRPDGSWLDAQTKNNEYGTAMASIILQMPNNYLPIFQR